MVPGAFSAPRDGDRLRFQKASDPSRRHGRVSLSAEAVRPDRAAGGGYHRRKSAARPDPKILQQHGGNPGLRGGNIFELSVLYLQLGRCHVHHGGRGHQ